MGEWEPYKVVALGTPCGGTVNLSTVLQHRGLRVGHEEPARHGYVCGFAAWASEDYRPRQRLTERPQWLVQVVRHPLPTSETLPYYVAHPAPEMIQAHPWEMWVDEAQFRALRYWVLTHERIREMKPDAVVVVGPRYWDQARALLHRLRHAKTMRGPPTLPEQALRVRSKPAENRWPRMSWRRWHRADSQFASRAEALMEAIGMDDADANKTTSSPLERVRV